jgi:ABC-type sugar transport system ATPase subunit
MIRVENLGVRAGQFQLAGVNFAIPTGCYAVMMGKTGSGKTTLLEALCGLRAVAAGGIWLDGHEVTHLDPAWRGIGYVPQDRALFQTMTVYENLAFGMAVRQLPQPKIQARIGELAGLLGIAHLLDRHPLGLSGGESQRVALGRALAIQPRILCLDEPLSALDEETRVEMYTLLRSVRERTRVTILHVTHHPGEARQLADRLYRLEAGAVREVER